VQPTSADRYRNAMTGLAAGDAWGYQVEFVRYADMPGYPVAPPPGTWIVSDDTKDVSLNS
jgi:ADP-ribosylglycohydrolase